MNTNYLNGIIIAIFFNKVIDYFYGKENVSKDLLHPLLEYISASDNYYVLTDKSDKISHIFHEQFIIIQDNELKIKPLNKALRDICESFSNKCGEGIEMLLSGIESGDITDEDLKNWI